MIKDTNRREESVRTELMSTVSINNISIISWGIGTADFGISTQSFAPAHNPLTDTGTRLLALLSCPPVKSIISFPVQLSPLFQTQILRYAWAKQFWVHPTEGTVCVYGGGGGVFSSALQSRGSLGSNGHLRTGNSWLWHEYTQFSIMSLHKEHFYPLDPHQTLTEWCGSLTQPSEMFDHSSCQVLELLFDEVFKDSCIWSWFASGARIMEGVGSCPKARAPTDTCLQFVPLWNFLAGSFLIKLSAWFPVMSIQLSH